MASQQQQIIDTIFNMKRKLLRKDDTDTDEADAFNNDSRQDLKRKVQYARGSDPDFLLDPRPYKKRVDHAGYKRYILQRNPPRFDPDGDVVDPDDEYEDEDDLEAVQENPYANIQLENLLAPLTSAADLPTHPALSVAYTSRHLTDLANEAGELSRKEQVTIARAQTLHMKLIGDSAFAPDALAGMGNVPWHDPWTNGASRCEENGVAHRAANAEAQDPTAATVDVDMEDAGRTNGTNGETHAALSNGTEPVPNGASHDANADPVAEDGDMADDASDTASQQTAHRMTTRARAQAASTPSPPHSPSSDVHAIHPLYTFSTDSLPDRDLGLPPQEAEDTRMLLLAYVQKQEEVARATADLYRGMLQADRMRQDVFKWSKAETHVGEMSDGEDWYDNEEWSLDQDLLKGRDEEDDETAVPCSASLHNPDDVVVAGLTPSEDYKTSVLSGLSPTVIMECASRGLAFHSYQTSQEIIYQEHLAKGLTEKYNTLSQQMDQLIHEANSQIKDLQDKMHAMQSEHNSLEAKNLELLNCFKEKSKSQQHIMKLYQALKAQVMASHVATAAGDEAEMTLQTARGDRFIDRLPGTRIGTASYSQMELNQQMGGGRSHVRDESRSSGSSGHQQRGGVGLGPSYASHLQGRGLGGRMGTGQSAPVETPSNAHRSRLPVLGSTRQNVYLSQDTGPPYQNSPMTRQPLGGGVARNLGSFGLGGGGKTSRRSGGTPNNGPLGR
ncbi:hypothetical protein CC86DRAFT_279026 [Ophiobolus disseminans]|uniref:Transcriptional regulatory protein RXT2 N-terminal domain-containing protein n=1 Tax=Ophiobolus disseminans TaxID=1469910 RepID=A0A6A7AKH1_9PLEO|nr:hypothetical protein CC86DRAFT_279026 [Ophiobolus disseminans]